MIPYIEFREEQTYENSNQIASGNVKGMELAAMTRFREQYRQLLKPALDQDTPVFQSADEMFEAVDNGSLKIDAVIITTPHLSHEQIALEAFRRGTACAV